MECIVVKSFYDSFEREVDQWFDSCNIEVVSTEELFEDYSGFKLRHEIFKKIKKMNIPKDCKVIVFDNLDVFLIFSLLHKKTYLWIWNKVLEDKRYKLMLRIAALTSKAYSFDPGDCRKYGLGFNTQFFTEVSSEDITCDYDVYFVGKDKGRYSLVKDINQVLTENGFKPLIQVKGEAGIHYDNDELIVNDFIEYDEVISNIKKSRAVLDFAREGQEGMTFRAMEALAYDKKIITNNPNYRELPFYAPDKVFVIEENNLEGMTEFLEAPDISYSAEIKDYYSIDNWIKRFV